MDYTKFPIIQFFSTIVVFYIEAVAHYNIGKTGRLNILKLKIPDLKESSLILIIITIFAFISSTLTYYLNLYLFIESRDDPQNTDSPVDNKVENAIEQVVETS
tara:strand:+ start:7206 stop:7514 length:309 start_codon:yes stop_codon:yes gene_type:complete